MNLSKKFLQLFQASLLALLLCACGGNSQEAAEQTTAVDSTAAEGLVPANEALFSGMVINHTVADFPKWKAGFDAHEQARTDAGLTVISVLQDKANPNSVTISLKADDVQKARDFAASPDLKATMQKAGVTSAPEVTFFDVLRLNEGADAKADRLLVKHHVQDFDAWVKVFDEEGTATRTSNGVVDRVLARGIDDPNLVLISFAVTDMAKAQARVNSPELKDIMQKAGVTDQPQINFYSVAK